MWRTQTLFLEMKRSVKGTHVEALPNDSVNRNTWTQICSGLNFICHRSQMDLPGTEPEPPERETGN